MDFSLTQEQRELKTAVIQFARKELAGDVIGRDKRGVFPRDLWKKCAEFGIHGLPFPAQYGGQGSDLLTTLVVMEGLGYACRDNGLVFGINAQMWSVQTPILEFGTEEQKQRYLPGLIAGDIIGAHGMSEPGSGSDSHAMNATAVRNGDHYILNGTKTFVSNAPVADLFVVFASTDKKKGFMGITGFLVDKDTPGFSVSREIEKMGLKTDPMAELILDECRVPAANRLGREGQGAAIFRHSMEFERGCIFAGTVGSMERQLEHAIEHARQREQFGRPIGKFQATAHKLADMKVRLETARLLIQKMAWTRMTEGSAPIESAMAKLYLSEAWVQSCLDTVQIFGGYGYSTEYEVERDLRDAVGGKIYSGTSEIQRELIARLLGL